MYITAYVIKEMGTSATYPRSLPGWPASLAFDKFRVLSKTTPYSKYHAYSGFVRLVKAWAMRDQGPAAAPEGRASPP